ncbi:hypothetical protein DFH06DRAFT_1480886 [Mycena polygramma]|nr:hypothetical protein DFH06DRAFT_1480886 [Mycena polygramma]
MSSLRNIARSSPRLQSFKSFRIARPLLSSPQLRPYYNHSPRPSFPARLFFRADGTSRSRGPGLVIPLSLMLLSVLAYTNRPTTSIDLDSFIQSDEARLLLSVLADIQRVDEDYTNVPFDSYRSSMDYFVQLYTCVDIFSHIPPEHNALILHHAMLSESHAELREPIHAMFRDAAENVHNILASRQDMDTVLATLETALNLQLCLSRAYGELIRLLHEDVRRQLLEAARTDPKKDAGTNPEILG